MEMFVRFFQTVFCIVNWIGQLKWPIENELAVAALFAEAPGPIPMREGTTELQVHGSDISCCCNFCYSVHSTAYGTLHFYTLWAVSSGYAHPKQYDISLTCLDVTINV